MTAAGSEDNVSGLLSEPGRSTAWATKLPKGEPADRVALDVSFRSLPWSGERVREVLEPIARRSDTLFCSRTDARVVFGRGIAMGTRVAQIALTHDGDLTRVRSGELEVLQGSDIVRRDSREG